MPAKIKKKVVKPAEADIPADDALLLQDRLTAIESDISRLRTKLDVVAKLNTVIQPHDQATINVLHSIQHELNSLGQ